MAEAVFQHLVDQVGLSDQFEIDSVGTDSYHVGDPTHPGTRRILASHGVSCHSIARQVSRRDLERADYIIAMDRSNVSDLRAWAPRNSLDGRVHLLLDFVNEEERRAKKLPARRDVPDPYYTGNFEEVYQLVEAGCRGLLTHIRREHGL
jgi:protein-tyrosine phosphatase